MLQSLLAVRSVWNGGCEYFLQLFFMSSPVVAYGYNGKPFTTLSTLLRPGGVYYNCSVKKGESKGNFGESRLWRMSYTGRAYVCWTC